MAQQRELHLSLNLFSPGAGWNRTGTWSYPDRDIRPGIDLDSYRRAARTAERGLFDSVFVADVPRLRAEIVDGPVHTLEPTVLLTHLAANTERIGVVVTASTSFNEPFNIARRIQSLDVVSEGRAAWNAVTTWDPVTGANFGVHGQWTREVRYARAGEFIDTVRALWRSWDRDAIVADRNTGMYADPNRIHRIDHEGEFFSVRGPLTLPPSTQGEPMLFQAGGSDLGRDLAGRTADAVFSAVGTFDTAVADRAEYRARAQHYGRNPNEILVLPGLRTFVGGTDEEARERWAQANGAADTEAELSRLADVLLVPIDSLSLDKPVPLELIPDNPPQLGYPIGFRRTVVARAREGATVRRLLESGGANGHLQVVGSAQRVADLIERWYRGGAADGFNIMPDSTEKGFDDFVDHVVPLLQHKGIFRTEYQGSTLRDHYGLPVAADRHAIPSA